MELILKIKDNLHIIGNTIVSYETEVATISENAIISAGSFSRTTGKHVKFISQLLNKPVIQSSKRRKLYDKLHYGAKCKYDNSLSIRGSISVATEFCLGANLMTACARVWSKLGNQDRSIIRDYYGYVGKGKDFEDLVVIASLGIIVTDEPIDISKISV